MKRTLAVSASVILLAVCSLQAQTIATWTFETSVPTTAGPYSPEVGSGDALGSHANGSTVYSNPVGNGSGESFSANFWTVGDYYQFHVSTLGFSGIGVSFDQISSTTGPRDFDFQYSIDGSLFTTFASYTVTTNSSPQAWSSGTPVAVSSYSFDLSSITDLDETDDVYFRLTDTSTTSAIGGTVATSGTDRVDNFSVFVAPPVPEPSTIAMASIGGIALLMAFRRRN